MWPSAGLKSGRAAAEERNLLKDSRTDSWFS
jgi:hypothetical protein